MNFLAHIYLSEGHPAISVGNFMADAVKGSRYKNYPKAFKQGILLHRSIDYFTDTHDLVKKSKRFFSLDYGLYSGILVDMYFDHLLAKNWSLYHEQSLQSFAAWFYDVLQQYEAVLPEPTRKIAPYLISGNWLVEYASEAGIQQILWQMQRRIKAPKPLEESFELYLSHQSEISALFIPFFEALRRHCHQYLGELLRA
ncbi:MAG: ACP phosphodiesterase [Flavobacteriaceae bacterium]|nr:ACP phosphodiesterase [Flavobacteriaceae bacterium]